MVITSIITVKEEGKERGGEAVREDGGVVVAIHLDPRVAVVRRHNPEMGMIMMVIAMIMGVIAMILIRNLMIMLIILVKMGGMVMP